MCPLSVNTCYIYHFLDMVMPHSGIPAEFWKWKKRWTAWSEHEKEYYKIYANIKVLVLLSLESPRKSAEVSSYLEIQKLQIHELMYNQSGASFTDLHNIDFTMKMHLNWYTKFPLWNGLSFYLSLRLLAENSLPVLCLEWLSLLHQSFNFTRSDICIYFLTSP